MLTNEVRIVIPGHPAPKGSLKCIGGRGGRGHVLIEDNARTKDWRIAVSSWVRRKWPTHQHAEPGQAIGAEITFTLPRPKGHYRTGKNAHLLRDTAPAYPVGHSTGDVDKLLRLALDALQDTDVLPDDCAVVETHAVKAYPRPLGVADQLDDVLGYPGVAIRLYPIGDTHLMNTAQENADAIKARRQDEAAQTTEFACPCEPEKNGGCEARRGSTPELCAATAIARPAPDPCVAPTGSLCTDTGCWDADQCLVMRRYMPEQHAERDDL